MTSDAPALFDRSTLRERSTAHVRGRIISGDLAPGDHLIETVLAEEMGVSRGTLRESLRPLEVEGLLTADGKGHLSVRRLSSREVLEVFEVREALEVLAASKLAASSDRTQAAAELRRCLDPLRGQKIGFSEQIRLDLGFHARMCELTGNQTLLASWRRLTGQLEMIIIAAGPRRAAGRMRYEEHVVIIEAIETGDVEQARSVVAQHMKSFASKYVTDAEADEATQVSGRQRRARP